MAAHDDWVWLIPFLTALVSHSPSFAVYLFGIIFALLRWGKHPQVSFLTVLALVLIVLTSVATSFLFTWMPIYLFEERGWSHEQYTTVTMIISVGSSVVYAAAFALLLVAVFSGRPRPRLLMYPPPQPPPAPPPPGSQDPHVRDFGPRAP